MTQTEEMGIIAEEGPKVAWDKEQTEKAIAARLKSEGFVCTPGLFESVREAAKGGKK